MTFATANGASHQHTLSEQDILAALKTLSDQSAFNQALRVYLSQDPNFEVLFLPIFECLSMEDVIKVNQVQGLICAAADNRDPHEGEVAA